MLHWFKEKLSAFCFKCKALVNRIGAYPSAIRSWLKTNLPLVWKARWFLVGVGSYFSVLALSAALPVKHSTGKENHYSIAWTYITLVVAVISILYPLALTIRDSLTARLFSSWVKLRERVGNEQDEEFKREFYSPLQRFRTILFDIQLPILVTFSLLSVIRVLLCLISLGPLTLEQQLIEPQIYILAYLVWMIWVAGVVLWLRPYYVVETAETKALELPIFEQSFTQELREQTDAH